MENFLLMYFSWPAQSVSEEINSAKVYNRKLFICAFNTGSVFVERNKICYCAIFLWKLLM